MTYKETLFFIGKCLTIHHEEHNKSTIEKQLQEANIDWDAVVKVSTKHYVFPALYCNFKKVNFLGYLPQDLVEYMQHITQLNRERNEQIIEQAKEINDVLLANNITPIFLKGTAFLLQGLYEDIAERMVGDIDFLVSKDEYQTTINLLLKNKYTNVSTGDNLFPSEKHYPRLQKENKIAAVEIHKEMTIGYFAKLFNHEIIKPYILSKDNISVLSYNDQVKLTIIAKQINDDGQLYNDISLRNSYDVFILSQKTDTKKSIELLEKKLKTLLNNFLAISKTTLNSNSINLFENASSEQYLKKFLHLIENKNLREKHYRRSKIKNFLSKRLVIILKAFYKKDYTIWLFNRIIKGREN
ncbi:nucleotidyltransferase family protein [Tenacibaculum sp. IB213877]|uniref:nucleotidyltransferase domain-containing protein n=1 Tax=Tenacibaculum sp. IB213877 TaxID=3097351 RepID=UPI002A5AACF0|nr:nucleotidyltransferase family protein [Tenacibaculum sp. IB213877]MDY0780104.1 nucleotidyltransferase family protein [Tenacibaculum sp. IB213877]